MLETKNEIIASVEDDDKAVVENALKADWNDINAFSELGRTGVRRNSGIIDEEFLPTLKGRKAVKIYREMAANDHVIGSLLFTITNLLRSVEWSVEAADTSEEQAQAKEFIEQCMQDMEHSWGELISDILTCLIYGWSFFEITYKKRAGIWEKGPNKSKHNDGMIGWRKIQLRSQETLHRWVFNDVGDCMGMIQLAPPKYKQVMIPMSKGLLFRYGSNKNSPEGVSMLRNLYPLHYSRKRLMEFVLIGVERDLAGLPISRVPMSWMTAAPGTKDKKAYDAVRKMTQNVRRDEHDGLVIPALYDPETKQPLIDFELLNAGGGKQFDAVGLLDKIENAMLSAVLADFIRLGQDGVGSYSMHISKTGIFRQALSSLADDIADVFNRQAIPQLLELNGMTLEQLPQIRPEAVDPPNLGELTQFMTGMAQMGMEWFPDADLETYLRQIAHLPEQPEDVIELRRDMSDMHNQTSHGMTAAEYQNTQQMHAHMQSGMSMEQAQQHMQLPEEQMTERQVMNQSELQRAQQNVQMEGMMEQHEGQMQQQQEQMQMAQQQQEQQMMHEQEKMQMQQMNDEYKAQNQQAMQDMKLEHANQSHQQSLYHAEERQAMKQQEEELKSYFEYEDMDREQQKALLQQYLTDLELEQDSQKMQMEQQKAQQDHDISVGQMYMDERKMLFEDQKADKELEREKKKLFLQRQQHKNQTEAHNSKVELTRAKEKEAARAAKHKEKQATLNPKGEPVSKMAGALALGAAGLYGADIVAARRFKKKTEDPEYARSISEKWNAEADTYSDLSKNPAHISMGLHHLKQADRAALEYTLDSKHFFNQNRDDRGRFASSIDSINPVALRSKGLNNIALNSSKVNKPLYRGMAIPKGSKFEHRPEAMSTSPLKELAVSYAVSPGGRGRGLDLAETTPSLLNIKEGAHATFLPGARRGQPEYLVKPGLITSTARYDKPLGKRKKRLSGDLEDTSSGNLIYVKPRNED